MLLLILGHFTSEIVHRRIRLGVVDANAQKMPALFVGDDETGRIVTWPGDVPEPAGGRFAEGGEIISVKPNVGGKVEVRWAGYGEAWDTWEPAANIPEQFIQQYRELVHQEEVHKADR